MIEADIIHIRKIGADKAEIWARPRGAFSHVPGQYAEVTFAGYAPRFYSIANAPRTDGIVTFHIKDHGSGGASSYALASLTEGSAIHLRGPFGTGWDWASGRPAVLVAGGMGVTPMRAIVEAYVDAQRNESDAAPLTLIWGVERREDLYLNDVFTHYASQCRLFTYKPVWDRPVTAALSDVLDDYSGHQIYLSGAREMVSAGIKALLRLKAAPEFIRSDYGEELVAQLAERV